MKKDNKQSNLKVAVISVLLISIAVILAFHTQLSTKAFAVDNNSYVGEKV